jgi:hypothetical protein
MNAQNKKILQQNTAFGERFSAAEDITGGRRTALGCPRAVNPAVAILTPAVASI